MPLPRISGLLNNCALFTALPTLMKGIHQLAERERAGTLGELEGNAIFQNYSRLKDNFAHHYHFNANVAFNWRALDTFIESHSFYANEIIFSPVLRNFIAEVGPAAGYTDLGVLRDVQNGEFIGVMLDDENREIVAERARGRYEPLVFEEAARLYHNHFGISVQKYKYIVNRGTTNPEDNYNHNPLDAIASAHTAYPFGTAPMLKLYFKGDHWELQPHESLAEANREFNAHIAALPSDLAVIHNGISCSYTAFETNRMLGLLLRYVHQALSQQLAPPVAPALPIVAPQAPQEPPLVIANAAEAPRESIVVAENVVPQPPAGVIEQPISTAAGAQVSAPQQGKNPKAIATGIDEVTEQGYLISARDYAENASAFAIHNDTYEGRQTFAVILLTILVESKNEHAQSMLTYLEGLSAANGDNLLASYLSNMLAKAIIESKGDLDTGPVASAVAAIKLNEQANLKISSITQLNLDEKQVRLVNAAQHTIKQAWELYQQTKDATLIAVINKTQAVIVAPTPENLQAYNVLREQINGKGSWGKIVAGLMLSVLGLALIVGAAFGAVATLGLATPVSLPVIAAGVGMVSAGIGSGVAGIGFFRSGRDAGLYKEMQHVSDEAKGQLASN